MHISTILAHAGLTPDPTTGAITPPIELSTIFKYPENGYPEAKFGYTRHNNPGRLRLEEALANLEGGQDAAAFGSGIAAMQAVIQALGKDAHLLVPDDLYHGFRTLLLDYSTHWGLEVSFVDMRQPDQLVQDFRQNTRMIWIETPSNPMLNLTDIRAITTLAQSHDILTCVDNTWMTPVLQKPLVLGADLVMHSTTKYMGGHSDILGGAIITKEAAPFFARIREIKQVSVGVPSTFDLCLLLRSLRTLYVRMHHQMKNAQIIADWLSRQPEVSKVYYPDLSKESTSTFASQQMMGPGAMISFLLNRSAKEVLSVVSKSKIILPATSLGGVESTWEHRYSSEGPTSKTPDQLIRLSVGIEDVHDLIKDIERALS